MGKQVKTETQHASCQLEAFWRPLIRIKVYCQPSQFIVHIHTNAFMHNLTESTNILSKQG
jgi:tRNA U38,U39,U40 pseudouridine synthase TruA